MSSRLSRYFVIDNRKCVLALEFASDFVVEGVVKHFVEFAARQKGIGIEHLKSISTSRYVLFIYLFIYLFTLSLCERTLRLFEVSRENETFSIRELHSNRDRRRDCRRLGGRGPFRGGRAMPWDTPTKDKSKNQ